MSREALRLEQVEENEWKFEYTESIFPLNEKLYKGIDLMKEGQFIKAEKIFRTIIKEFPEHFDAYHHLAMILDSHGKKKEALQLWENAVDTGKRYFPDNFSIGRDHLDWGWLENRPFLRVCHGLGLAYFEKGEANKALSIFNDILALNPGDNQGIRALITECGFSLNSPEEVLKVSDKYPEDGMVEILYGRPLALFQIGKREEAEKAMKEAIRLLPLVAKELIKTRHRKPKSAIPGYIKWGGADEAYEYWKMSSKYWKNTEGAIDFVKECLDLEKFR